MNQDLFDSLCNMIFARIYSTNEDEKTETINIYRNTFEDRSALIRQYDKKYLKENFLDDYCTLHLGFVSPFAREILEMPPENLSEKGRKYAEYLDLSLVREIGQLSPEENKRYARLVINNPYAQLTEYVKTAACSGALGNNTASLIEMEIHNQLVNKVAHAEVNDVLKYLLLVEKSRRVGLTDAENETIDKYENSNEFFANLSSKISDDYQMLNNIEFDEIVYDYSDKFNGTEKMQEITNKFVLDESGNIVEKKTGNYFTPRSAKEEATMTFSCIWFNSIDNNMDIDNNRLIQLFISYAEHSAGKEQNFEVFRRLVRDAGLNIGNNELMKIQTIAEPLRDIALGMKGYSEYEKEHGRVYVDLEKLAGICGIESDDADYYDMRMRKLIDYKFPERYQKSTAYYDRYATTMCNTLSGIMGGIKTQVIDGAEAIDTREIIKKFPRCSKERKYAKRLLATDEDVQVVCDVTVNKLHLDYKSANVITPISVEQAIDGPRLSA